MSFEVRRLGPQDIVTVRQLNDLFGAVFEDPTSYTSAPPRDAYLERVLGSGQVIALVAVADEAVVGGLVGYVLDKLEQERSEIYIYDLAVAEPHRRQGVATALIAEVRSIAAEIGAWVIYIQADYGDEPAIALYSGLGKRENVLHFDIAPRATR